jgi:DNA-binding NarL/FixJ family response regulator
LSFASLGCGEETFSAGACYFKEGRNASVPKTRVLLADDNEQVLQYVCEFLSADSCEIIATATDGQAAVHAAAKLLPDLVVLDISMPVLNGMQAAERILAANRSLRIIFLTAAGDPDMVRAAFDLGACGYVLKRRMATDLYSAIEAAKNGGRFVSPGCD